MINLFAHRGFWNGDYKAQNTIASLRASHLQKFYGIEFDVWFFENKLVLKHDQPQANEALIEFANYFEFANDFKYWIDFKNLDEVNAGKVFELVKKQLENLKIADKNIFIAPFITDYSLAQKVFEIAKEIFAEKLNFAAVLENQEQTADLIKFINKNNIKYLSIFHQLIDENLLKKLGNIELFPWTVNDLQQIKLLKKLGIKNFITDQITPEIYDRQNQHS